MEEGSSCYSVACRELGQGLSEQLLVKRMSFLIESYLKAKQCYHRAMRYSPQTAPKKMLCHPNSQTPTKPALGLSHLARNRVPKPQTLNREYIRDHTGEYSGDY